MHAVRLSLALCAALGSLAGVAQPSSGASVPRNCAAADSDCTAALVTYIGWRVFQGQCATCHAADARGSSFAPTARLTFGFDVINSSSVFFRGDEGNLAEELDGYTLLNARVEYRLGEHALLFLTVDNLLDEEYATFGLFGEPDEVLGDDFEEPEFVSPGAPRAAWAGVRVEF